MATDSYLQGNGDNAVVVPFSDDESEAANDTLEEDKPEATPEEKATRRQRRQERLNRLITEGKQSKEELDALKGEHGNLRAELERVKGYLAAQPTQRPANDDGKNPYEKRLDAVYEKQQQAYNAAQAEIKAGSFSEERQKYYEKIAREVESEKTRIHTEQVVDARSQTTRAEQAQQIWAQKYPEIYGNPRAYEYASSKYRMRTAGLGEQPTNALVEEVMTETMTVFKMGARPAPTASDKSRMSGIPSAGTGGGGAKSSGISMTPELRRMAIAAHPDLSEADALKKWTNTTGKRLRDRKVI